MFKEIVSRYREYPLMDRVCMAIEGVAVLVFAYIAIMVMAVLWAPSAKALPVGKVAAAPPGYVSMIVTDPDTYLLMRNRGDAVIRLNTNSLARIQDARDVLRSQFSLRKDPYGRDVWRAATEGDCDDFALKLLLDLHKEFPGQESAIGLATAFTEKGIYHLVTTIETNGGTIICDNRIADCGYDSHFERIGYVFKIRFTGQTWREVVK